MKMVNQYTLRNASAVPELEVHSNRSMSPTIGRMTDEPSSTLRSMIQRQASTMVELRKSELTAITAAETTEESKCDSESHSGWHAAFQLGSSYIWSDSDDTSLPAASPGSDLHDSIEAIREEASRVDTAIALDKLDTLKNELNSLRKELSSRDSEIRGLKQSIQVKDTRLSTLQLERDLYKADVGCDENATAHSSTTDSHFVPPWSPFSSQLSMAEDRSTPDDHKLHSKTAGRNRHAPSRVLPIRPKTTTIPPIVSPIRPITTIPPVVSGPKSTLLLDRPKQQIKPTEQQHAFQLVQPARTSSFHSSFHESTRPRAIVRSAAQTSPGHPMIEPASHSSASGIIGAEAKIQRSPSSIYQIADAAPVQLVPVPRSAVLPLFTQNPPSIGHHHENPQPQRWNPSTPRLGSSSVRAFAPPQPRQLQYDELSQSRHDASGRMLPAQLQDDLSLASHSTSTRSRFRRGPNQDDASADTNRRSRAKTTRSRSKRTESTVPPSDAETGSKTCLPVPNPLRHRRSKKTHAVESRNGAHSEKEDSSTFPSYKMHADELTHLLRSSLETSDELRKRLAMISTYYENVVQELQSSMKSTDAQRAKIERELLHQIAVLERAQKLAAKEYESRRQYKQPGRNRVYSYGV
ncbi:hypothetical protein ACA910_010305 [Epithemia clementina (nom. ined.)]